VSAILITGFPGFLGSILMERLLQRSPADVFLACLVQRKFSQMARQRADAIEQKRSDWSGRIRLFEGDITVPDLGLGRDYDYLAEHTGEIYHLAAVYDLAVKLAVGMRINVDGTRHMLRFAEKCRRLSRFHYVSTCYVSGRYPGHFTENDLEKGQSFNNFYEQTKYLAEVEVQRAMREGLPITIYRPAIVVGHSKTGETQKYDGPYFIIQWIVRQPLLAVMPTVIGGGSRPVNLLPSDFLIDALAYLSGQQTSRNKVYQLCNPAPPSVDELLDILAKACRRRLVKVPLPKIVAKGALKYVPGVYRLLRIEPEAIEYFVHPTTYACDNTLQDLAGTGIVCPPFADYAEAIVEYFRRHPEISSAAMV